MMEMKAEAAAILAQARISQRRIPSLPPQLLPRSEEQAYEIQSELIPLLLAQYGGKVAGYKVACTNPIAQQQLGVPGPFLGQLLSPFCLSSPAEIETSQFFMRVVEAEFAFRMAADLAPRATPWSREEIAGAVEGILPAFEIVDSRYHDWEHIGAPSLIADNACNGAWVFGETVRNWRHLDLAAQRTQVFVNGALNCEGSGAAVLGNPLNALEWLINRLNARGMTVQAGDYMSTGVTTKVYMAERGDRVTADFGPVGRVEVTFV
jgi:2-keto-4-pentenoate hydratase